MLREFEEDSVSRDLGNLRRTGLFDKLLLLKLMDNYLFAVNRSIRLEENIVIKQLAEVVREIWGRWEDVLPCSKVARASFFAVASMLKRSHLNDLLISFRGVRFAYTRHLRCRNLSRSHFLSYASFPARGRQSEQGACICYSKATGAR